jgi:hypothetical protein
MVDAMGWKVSGASVRRGVKVAVGVGVVAAGVAVVADPGLRWPWQQPSPVVAWAVLDGTVEPAGGDPEGYGSVVVFVAGTGRICYQVAANLPEPGAIRLHRGVPGPGRSIEPLVGTVDGLAEGCVRDTLAADEFRVTPWLFSLYVDTPTFPYGAVGGQLRGAYAPSARG